jgi:acetylornithine deacetylase/succinyl-diaminopimelate desuccinylase-like protein
VNSVELLRNLLQVRSINPPGDEAGAAAVLEAYLSDAGLETDIVVSPGGRSNLVARLEGPQDHPALVLLSHSDVVPVEEDKWSRDPFGGDVAEGFIWGRGALDMKSIAVMHAVAAGELARFGHTPTREVIVVVVADEEAGGDEGAGWLLDEYRDRLGFGDGRPPPEVLGEGAYGVSGLLERPIVFIALGEKTAIWFDLIAEGDPGHGALPPQHQAPVNLAALVNEIAGFGRPRVHPVMREQFSNLTDAASGPAAAVFRALASPAGGALTRLIASRLPKSGPLGLLLSDSITPTVMEAGYKSNVVPTEARAFFDCRLLPDTDITQFVASVDKEARRRSARVANVVQKGHGPVSGRSRLLHVLERVSAERFPSAAVTVSLSPGITDVRFFRAQGANGYGWCPLVLSSELLATIHGHDERVGLKEFERAVSAMSDVVRGAAT